MKPSKFFLLGFREMIPIMSGTLPFAAVMGTVAADAGLSFWRTMSMNMLVYAGAAQLAAVELMTKNAASAVVVLTGLIINLRFLLYSAAMAPTLRQAPRWVQLACAHSLTDQSYAVTSAHQEKTQTNADMLQLYFGASVCMFIFWQLGVMLGYAFGNIAPAELALDYAVPLSFAALVVPTLKNRKYVLVALFSTVLSLCLHGLPYRLGLIATALPSIGLSVWLTRKGQTS